MLPSPNQHNYLCLVPMCNNGDLFHGSAVLHGPNCTYISCFNFCRLKYLQDADKTKPAAPPATGNNIMLRRKLIPPPAIKS